MDSLGPAGFNSYDIKLFNNTCYVYNTLHVSIIQVYSFEEFHFFAFRLIYAFFKLNSAKTVEYGEYNDVA